MVGLKVHPLGRPFLSEGPEGPFAWRRPATNRKDLATACKQGSLATLGIGSKGSSSAMGAAQAHPRIKTLRRI